MSQDYLARIAALEDALRQKDCQLSLVAETESFLRSALARAEEKIENEEREIEHLRAQIEKLRRMLFGYHYVMDCRKLHTDDTPVPVLAPGRKKTKTGRIWTYVRDDRNAGSSDPPAAWFAFSPDRQEKHPQQYLRHYHGVLQADAFAGYDRLFSAERDGGPLTEAACWAHARRKIHDVYISTQTATAAEVLKRIYPERTAGVAQQQSGGTAAMERRSHQ